jgi:MFS family permease
MAGHSLAFPNAGALVSRSTDPHEQGSVNGLLMACNALARIIAPPVYGFVYSALGPDAPYYLCTLMIGGAAIVGLQAVRVRDAELRIQEEKIA